MVIDRPIAVFSNSFSASESLRSLTSKSFSRVSYFQSDYDTAHQPTTEVLGRIEGAIIGLTKVDKEFLSFCPNLKIISKYGVGLDNIDFNVCGDLGIEIRHSQGVNKTSVAEHTLAMVLSLFHNFGMTNKLMLQGIWKKSGGHNLHRKTVGIVGLGNVGIELATLLSVFKCRILYYDIVRKVELEASAGVSFTPLRSLISTCDVISLHASLNPTSEGMIGRRELEAMKRGAILINTARAALIDYQALKDEVMNGTTLAGVGLDVFPNEPFFDIDFLSSPKVIATPHSSGNSQESIIAMGTAAVQHLHQFFAQN